MKLVHPSIQLPLIENEHFNISQIENSKFLWQFQRDLWLQMQNDQGNFVLSKDGTEMSLGKNAHVLLSPALIEVTSRSTINVLHKVLVERINASSVESLIMQKMAEVYDLINVASQEERFVVLKNDMFQMTDILKFYSPGFEFGTSENLIDVVEDYLLVMAEYAGKKVFILTQFLGYLNSEELEELAQFAAREELYLLCVESHLPEHKKIEGARWLIIDNELCELLSY